LRNATRLVFNALPLDAQGGGVSTYIRELLAALADRHPNRRPDDSVDDPSPRPGVELIAAVRPSGSDQLPSGVDPLIRGESTGVVRAIDGARGVGPADLVHGLDVDLPFWGKGRMVCTVHDLAIVDLPETFPRLRAAGERILMGHALRRADAVVAVSAFTAERVKVRFGREASVTPLAPGPGMAPPDSPEAERVRAAYGLPERFVLHVGNIEPRKDIATLAAACRIVAIPLVLTGHSLWGHRAPAGVVQVGTVPRGDLPGLYGAATVVGYASRYEGFGLPPIEAMACGAAVVSTPVPSVTEATVGGVELFHPGDADGLATTLRRLMEDDEERQELAQRGRTKVAALSWDGTAELTESVYRSLGVAI